MLTTSKSNSYSIINEFISECKNCGQCNLSCQTHFAGLFNPLGLLRDLEMNGESLEKVISNQSIFNCISCNRCMVDCPTHAEGEGEGLGMDMASLILVLRQYAFENNITVRNKPEIPGCGAILQNQQYESDSEVKQKSPPKVGVLHYFKNEPDLKISKTGEIAYFIADLPQLQKNYPKFGAEFDQIPQSVVKILNHLNIKPVVINLKGSGHDDLWVGDFTTFKALAEFNVKAYRKAKVKIVVIENDEAYRTWKFDYPRVIPDFDFEVYHLSEFLMEKDFIRKSVRNFPVDVSFTYHDSSRLGRMGGGIYEAPRLILESLKGVQLNEMANNREYSFDFGITPYLQVNEDTKQMWVDFVKEVRDTGAKYFITSNPKTIAHYNYVISTLFKDGDRGQMPIVKEWAVFLNRFLR